MNLYYLKKFLVFPRSASPAFRSRRPPAHPLTSTASPLPVLPSDRISRSALSPVPTPARPPTPAARPHGQWPAAKPKASDGREAVQPAVAPLGKEDGGRADEDGLRRWGRWTGLRVAISPLALPHAAVSPPPRLYHLQPQPRPVFPTPHLTTRSRRRVRTLSPPHCCPLFLRSSSHLLYRSSSPVWIGFTTSGTVLC